MIWIQLSVCVCVFSKHETKSQNQKRVIIHLKTTTHYWG